jgi:hypothetical protein
MLKLSKNKWESIYTVTKLWARKQRPIVERMLEPIDFG